MKELIIPIPKSLQEQLKDFDPVEEYNSREGHLNNDGFYCYICKNKGHIEKRYEDDGGGTYYQECECWNRRRFVRFLKKKGLQELLQFKIKDFKVEQPFQEAMKDMALRYLQESNGEWFALLGQSGTGKTHINSAITAFIAKKNVNVAYMMWTSFVKEYKDAMFDKNKNENEILDSYKKAEFLFIDDFFKSEKTEYIVSTAFDLINYRYTNRLTTIFTSELLFYQLMGIDEAMATRIKERCNDYILEIERDPKKNYRVK